MANTLAPYLQEIQAELELSLKKMVPYVKPTGPHIPIRPEVEAPSSPTPEPKAIRRNSRERCLIEPSSNAVRCSFRLKQEDADPIEEALCHRFLRYLMQRAESYVVLRRVPVSGYSISFLVLNKHVDEFSVKTIVDFIVHFVQEVDKEISEMKISMNACGRQAATEFLKAF